MVRLTASGNLLAHRLLCYARASIASRLSGSARPPQRAGCVAVSGEPGTKFRMDWSSKREQSESIPLPAMEKLVTEIPKE